MNNQKIKKVYRILKGKKVYRVLKKNDLYNLKLLYIKTGDDKYFNQILKRFTCYINKYVNLFTNDSFEKEDLSQWARIGLWRGLLINTKKPYLVQNITCSIKTEVHNNFGKIKKIKKKEIFCLDKLINVLSSNFNLINYVHNNNLLERLEPKLTSYQKVVLGYLEQGYKQVDIARKLDAFENSISDAVIRIRRKLLGLRRFGS